MKRISTLAVTALPVSASLSVASPSAGQRLAPDPPLSPGGTRRRVDRQVRRPVHRDVGADGPGRRARYESRCGDNHDHTCRPRGSSPTSPGPLVSPPHLTASNGVDEAEVTYRGLCLDCSTAPRS